MYTPVTGSHIGCTDGRGKTDGSYARGRRNDRDGCEKHVSDAVYGVAGVIEIKASYSEKNTVVIYDGEQTGPEEIAAAIATTGYTVTEYTTTKTTSRKI